MRRKIIGRIVPHAFLVKAATPSGVRAYNGQGKPRSLLEHPVGAAEWKMYDQQRMQMTFAV